LAKYIGTLTSDARGKLGGVVLTKARNGTNLKSHSVPVNARSLFQQANRCTIAQSNSEWRKLSDSNQTTWKLLAAQYNWTNSLSQVYVPTAQQLYAQAFYNATQCGGTVPATAPMSPPSVAPVTSYILEGNGSFILYVLSNGGAAYDGAFFISASYLLPASINYTSTIRRRPMGGALTGNELFATDPYLAAWGIIPPVNSFVASRIVPCDPTYFISGTPLANVVQVEP
jgi:hypothetical protein